MRDAIIALGLALCALGAPNGLGVRAAMSVASDFTAEYKLYNEALAAGEMESAAAHALAAWQLAEAALGDHPTTAVLAYNYGQVVLFLDPAAAWPALHRADALRRAGIARLPDYDLDAYLAYAILKNRGGKEGDADNLFAALEARDQAIASASVESSRLWLELSVFYLNEFKYTRASEAAKRAEASLAAAVPGDYRGRAQAIMVQGVAVILPINRFVKDITKAHTHFARAQELFPLQRDIESFDLLLAQIMAWDLVAHAAIKSGRSSYRGEQLAGEWPEHVPVMENQLSNEECATEWEKQTAPDFPYDAYEDNYIGAVLIGYNVGDEGRPRDVKLLAEVPRVQFGEASLKALKTWRRRMPGDPRDGCRLNRLASFHFVR